MPNISQNLSDLKNEIAEIAKNCQRNPQDITLIAVSKTKPNEDIKTALNAGQIHFGENYVQEFEKKHSAFETKALKWHFIGHLQSNKIKDILGRVHLIHTLDRLNLAQKIQVFCLQKNFVQDCLIEVKLAQEETKSGCPVSELFDFVKALNEMPNIRIKGLMTIGTATTDSTLTQKEFRKLRELRDEINLAKIYREKLTELSMGMSQDYPIAIEEGATMIRVGSKIFGERQSHH